MQKKIIAGTLGFLLVLSIPAFAQNIDLSSNGSLPRAGLLPDHPLYFVKSLWENIRDFFTFGPEAKANLHLQLADQRLSELNESVAEGKFNLVTDLRERFDDEMIKVENNLNASSSMGRNVTDLSEHVAAMTFKHTLILQNLEGKLPDQANVENALNASMHGHENAVEHILMSRNVTGNVTITFSIGNQTFTETFNITGDNMHFKIMPCPMCKMHMENETENETNEVSNQKVSTAGFVTFCNLVPNTNYTLEAKIDGMKNQMSFETDSNGTHENIVIMLDENGTVSAPSPLVQAGCVNVMVENSNGMVVQGSQVSLEMNKIMEHMPMNMHFGSGIGRQMRPESIFG